MPTSKATNGDCGLSPVTNVAATMDENARTDPTDRSIPPGQDHQGHAHRENTIDRGLQENVRNILWRKKILVKESQCYAKQDERQ